MPRLLSEYFSVTPAALDALGVFDAFIDLDSQLHVDPHLLVESAVPEMQEAQDAITKYFEDTVALLDLSESLTDPLWEEARKRLELSELKGVSLGFSKGGSDGSAVGPGLAGALAERAFRIVKAGEKNPRIFELVGLFTDDFGPDRISDVVLRIAELPFARYTARVAASLRLPTMRFSIGGEALDLPVYQRRGKQRPLYFVPKDVLRELPVALDRSEIASVAAYNRSVRQSLNELFAAVGRDHPSKGAMWARVVQNPELMKALVQAYAVAGGSPYDFTLDPAAEYGRFLAARALAEKHPLDLAMPDLGWTPDLALQAVVAICEHFKRLVEANGLWDSFWIRRSKPAKALSERAMQRIFYGIALTYCREGKPDLDISPETNAGPGPVDFKFSHGGDVKVTVEMKKSNHGRLQHGYDTQLALYNRAERTATSIFLIMRIGDDATKIDGVLESRRSALRQGEIAPEVVIIDARPQESASKA
jgi:hypothetical protein